MTPINSNVTFETRVEIRQAFAARRGMLISNWFTCVEVGNDPTRWAARITECIDAELALMGGLN